MDFIGTVDVSLEAVETNFKVDGNLTRYVELVEDTNAEVHSIEVVGHRASHTSTSKWNEVPNTLGVVTKEHIAKVEQSLSVE